MNPERVGPQMTRADRCPNVANDRVCSSVACVSSSTQLIDIRFGWTCITMKTTLTFVLWQSFVSTFTVTSSWFVSVNAAVEAESVRWATEGVMSALTHGTEGCSNSTHRKHDVEERIESAVADCH